MGMATQPSVYAARASNYARASAADGTAYFKDGSQPTDGEVLEEDDEPESESAQEGRTPVKSAPFWPENWRRHC